MPSITWASPRYVQELKTALREAVKRQIFPKMSKKQEVSNHWDRGLQDGDHLIMEMIIILLTHQMSSYPYPSPASNLPSALP